MPLIKLEQNQILLIRHMRELELELLYEMLLIIPLLIGYQPFRPLIPEQQISTRPALHLEQTESQIVL